jgi:hypothetical protein
MRLIKEAAYKTHSVPFEEGTRFEIEQSKKVMVTEDAKEGPLAYAQKRKPVWKGR